MTRTCPRCNRPIDDDKRDDPRYCRCGYVVVNGETYAVHREGAEPEYMKPWREAWNLIQQDKLDEAAAHIRANVSEDDEVPQSTLVVRVMLRLGDRLAPQED